MPVGVYAVPLAAGGTGDKADKPEDIRVEAVIASLDGAVLLRDSVQGSACGAEALGASLANRLLAAGGREILRSIGIEL